MATPNNKIIRVPYDDFVTHIMGPWLTLPEQECGQKYNLTDSQKALVTILSWIRRKRKGLEFCQKHCIFPGPSGKKEFKKQWRPGMYDSCDIIQPAVDETRPWDPWVWYRHCLSTPHIEYLIVHRLRYVLSIFERSAFLTNLPQLMDLIIKNEIPLYINSPNWLIREFVTDVCVGKFQIEYKDFS